MRSIPIPGELIEILQPLRGGPFDYVFTQVRDKSKHHTNQSLRCCWNNFKRQLDIDMGATVYRNQIVTSVVAEDLTPYVLRHAYCTDLHEDGVELGLAKYLMGHADISTTANIYTHTSEASIDTAAVLHNAGTDAKSATNSATKSVSSSEIH